MATIYWEGLSTAVKQIGTGSIDTYDVGGTYTVTIGGETVAVAGDTDENTTAANLVTALEAATHPYFTAIDWTNPGAPADAVVATAAIAGVPFTAVLSAAGGGAAVTDFAATTASSGPSHWDDANNFAAGALPGAADLVVIENSSSEILYGLDTISDALGTVSILKTFTGKIGMDRLAFSTNGATVDTSVPEYREDYLKISSAKIDIGDQGVAGSPVGSRRIKISNILAGASVLTVFGTASSASESFLPAIRYIAAHANADVTVMAAPGGVGVGMDYDGETSTNGDFSIRATNSTHKLYVGSGVTYSNFEQFGGTNVIDAAATLTLVKATGGTLTINGDFTITTLTNDGAVITDNHIKTAGNAVTTLNNTTGTLDLKSSGNTRTIATLVQGSIATLKVDPDIVTITAFTKPTVPYQMKTTEI